MSLAAAGCATAGAVISCGIVVGSGGFTRVSGSVGGTGVVTGVVLCGTAGGVSVRAASESVGLAACGRGVGHQYGKIFRM